MEPRAILERDLWVLKCHGAEIDDGQGFTTDPVKSRANQDKFLIGEVVENADLVVWYQSLSPSGQSRRGAYCRSGTQAFRMVEIPQKHRVLAHGIACDSIRPSSPRPQTDDQLNAATPLSTSSNCETR
jgi:hypothetical protein